MSYNPPAAYVRRLVRRHGVGLKADQVLVEHLRAHGHDAVSAGLLAESILREAYARREARGG